MGRPVSGDGYRVEVRYVGSLTDAGWEARAFDPKGARLAMSGSVRHSSRASAIRAAEDAIARHKLSAVHGEWTEVDR